MTISDHTRASSRPWLRRAAMAVAVSLTLSIPVAVQETASAAYATTTPSNPPLGSDANRYRYGLNITWTSNGPGSPNPISKSDGTTTIGANPFAASFDVNKLVTQIAAMGFDYVQITDFHGAGTVLHPSAVLDSWRGAGYTSTVDVIGQLIDGLAARGIATFLFTHPLDGHDYSDAQQTLLGVNDPTGGYKKWNDFINAFYAELVDTYGSRIAGIGFDSELGLSGNPLWAGKLDMPRLRNTILSRQPDMWLGALAYPDLGNGAGKNLVDFSLKEGFRPNWLGGGLSPTNYDINQWPSFRAAANIVSQNHWATLGDYFGTGFGNGSTLDNFDETSGGWSVENSELSGTYGTAALSIPSGPQSETGWSDTFSDATYQFDFRIASDYGDSSNWAGLNVRKNLTSDAATSSGYLIIFRNNGEIQVSKPGAVLASVSTGLSFSAMTHVKVQNSGGRLLVYVGSESTPRIDVSDSTYSSGFTGFATYGTHSYFDTFLVERRWSDNFSTANAWQTDSGTWAASSGEFSGDEGRSTVAGKTWKNVSINVDLRITSNKGNSSNWAGVQLRKSSQADQFFTSGYLVYARSNGEVCIHKATVGNLACAQSGLTFSNSTHLKVVADGPQLRVYVGASATPLVEATDATYTSGYAGLSTSGAIASFDNFAVNAAPISESRLSVSQVFRYTVLQAGAATEGPGVGWSYSPFSDGQWEVGAKETLTAVKALMDPVRSSIIGTMPSNSYPLATSQRIMDLPNGIVATRKIDDSREYIHILNPPSGNTLQLPAPADGKTFSSAKLLANGVSVALVQNSSGVTLTLPSGQSWSSTDTVIELVTSNIGSGRYGGTNYLLKSLQDSYLLRGTGNVYTGTSTTFNVAGVPLSWTGVEDRWTLVYLGDDRYKIVNEFRDKMLRMMQDDYSGNADLSAVAMVPNGMPSTSDQWVIQAYVTGGLRIVSVGFGRPLHRTGDPYMGNSTVKSICGVPIFFNSNEDLWSLER